jgi:tRNA A-37 threonylcarbamoyl transferase component Bud32
MATVMRVAPDGYALGKRLHTGRDSEVYAAVRDADGAEVVLKTYLCDRSIDARPRALRELEALQRVAGPGIPRGLEVDRTTERPILVLEQVPGTPLASLVEAAPLAIEPALDVAIQLADVLARMHATQLLHRNIHPGNVLVERPGGRTWLIDFASAAELGAAEAGGISGDALDGTLHYIAPEQTRWLNRGCDARSDLYSLGATLYHAWTGRPPFEENDRVELIHAHLARVPRPPSELRPELPAVLSEILLKLLRKEPAERYQSARSLHADLLACREQWARSGHIDGAFELGKANAPTRPSFGRKLHGRESELAALRAAFERVVEGERTQVVMLRGEPGFGKSALVDELRAECARKGGYVASGKFDLYRERAFAGWADALANLAQQLLLESDARLEDWKERLRASLGNIAQPLLDLAPDLQFVVGEAPPVPPLGPSQALARLALALQRFMAVFSRERPLMLFLDDLQWSDTGSRSLLEELIANYEPGALLLIGAYRSNEVDAAHPVAALLERSARRGRAVETLAIGPLDADSALAMLGAALDRSHADLHGLAECIARKTGNSPLLIQQFVLHMHALGLIRFAGDRGWTWNEAALIAADIPDGAVAFMVAKLERLEPAARELIEFASCVGDQFDAEQLAALSGRAREALEPALYLLAEEGLIAPSPGGFRFVHDRIREAAQSLLSPEKLARVHYETGRLQLERTPVDERPQRALDIVEHLNRGRCHLVEDLRVPLIELNLIASERALASGAGATAAGYLGVAREIFRPADWATHRALGFDLYLQSAASAFQNEEHDAALALLDVLEARIESRVELALVASKRVLVYAMTRPTEECGRYALDILRQLGLRWPLHPSRLRGLAAMLVVRWLLRGRGADIPFRPATDTEPDWLAQRVFLTAANAILSRVDVQLQVLQICRSLRRTLSRGYLIGPGYTLAGYAVEVLRFHRDARGARQLGEQALAWAQRVPDPITGPRTEFIIHALLEPWLLRRRHALAPMERITRLAREVGDREFTHYSLFLDIFYRSLAGVAVSEGIRRMRELADSAGHGTLLHREASTGEQICRLLDEGSAADLERALGESDARLAVERGSGEPYLRTLWMLVLCVRGHHDLAFAQSQALGERLFRIVPFVHVADHTFYRGLAAAALATPARGWTRRRYARALARSLRMLRRWERDGPDFAHMALLLQAERARLRGDTCRARSLYEQSAQRAQHQEFVHHAALAHERRGRMLLDLRRETEAAAALRDASGLYRDWGALPKAEELVRERRRLGG